MNLNSQRLRQYVGMLLTWAGAGLLVLLAGCAPQSNQAQFNAQCASCHDGDGSGTVIYSPAIGGAACTLVDCSDGAALTAYIDVSMPSPGVCTGDCAVATCTFIVEGFPGGVGSASASIAGERSSDEEGIVAMDVSQATQWFGQCLSDQEGYGIDCGNVHQLRNYISVFLPSDDPRSCMKGCAMDAAIFITSAYDAETATLTKQQMIDLDTYR